MHHATGPTSGTAANQATTSIGQVITTEQFLAGLHPYYSVTDNHIEEPYIPLRKIEAIIAALGTGFDEETGELLLHHESLNWALIALADFTQEALNDLAEQEETYLRYHKQVEKRLSACSLVQIDPTVFPMLKTGQEVR